MKKYTLPVLLALFVVSYLSCKKTDPAGDDAPPAEEMPCIPGTLQGNVIAFYTFGSGSLKDVSGKGNHLQNITTASAGADRNGNPGCAYRFNRNAKEFLHTTNSGFLSTVSSFSVSLWYKP